jgi:hypothetical protein
MPETKALLILTWSRYLIKYPVFASLSVVILRARGQGFLPSEANVNRAASSLNRKRRSSGDLSRVSHRYDVHFFLGFSWMMA